MSVFAKAKTVETKKPSAKKVDEKAKYPIVGLGNYGLVDTVVKAFTALKATIEESCKEEMLSKFALLGTVEGKRPDNFRGIDPTEPRVSASCELRQRSGNSPLKPEEVEQLTKMEIPFATTVVQPECYRINPKYFTDADLLEKVSKVLEKIKDLPEDFIEHQPEVVKHTVNEDTINEVFKTGAANVLLNMVTVPAIKSTFDGTLVDALDGVKKLAGLATEAEKTVKTKKK